MLAAKYLFAHFANVSRYRKITLFTNQSQDVLQNGRCRAFIALYSEQPLEEIKKVTYQ
jgi:hypothetical protein